MKDDPLLAALLSSPHTAVVGAALDGTITRWSAGAQRLYGWSEAEILGRHFSLLVPENRRDEPATALAISGACSRGEEMPAFETVRAARDGSLVEVEVHVLTVRGEDGQPVGLLTLYRDLRRAHRAELALSASEQELHARFADSPVAQSRADLQGRVLAVNAAMEKLLGEPAEELIGRDALAMYVESDRQGLRDARARLASGAEHYVQHEVTLIRADGEPVRIVRTATAVRNADGDGPAVLAISVEDVTALRLAEQRMRTEAARFDALLQSMPVAVFSYDADGRYTTLRGQALDRLGLTEGELVGSLLPEVSAELPWARDDLLASLSGQETWSVADAMGRSWKCHCQPMRDDAGEVVGGLGIAVDITELAAAERQVGANEARLNALLRHADDVVLVVDRGGRLLYVSPAIARVFGYDDRALFWRQVSDFDHPDDRAAAGRAWRRTLEAEGATETFTCRVRHAGGAWCWCEIVFTNLLGDPDIGGFVINVRNITERRRAEEQLRHSALHDALTGLASRALLLDRIQHALHRSKRADSHTGLILLNVDGMAGLNDALGPDGGDVILQMVAERLVEAEHGTDSVARVGGDQFALLVEDVASAEGLRVRTSTLVDDLRGPVLVEGVAVEVSLRAGSALSPAANAGSLLAAAERALPASANGDRIVVAHAVVEDSGDSRVFAARAELRRGIERGELRLHYQPVMRLPDEAMAGVEALVRWQHPGRGLLEPAEFLPQAEGSDLMVQLGEWVLREACARAAAWQSAGQPFGVGINLSPRELLAADAVDLVRDILRETGARPDRLIFEVTESTLMDDERAPEILRDLKSLGVRLALDDFGTGYSSLTYLKRFPLDAIKIDRSFVAGLGRDADDEAIVASVVGLGRAIGKLVVAEGVETVAQRNALIALRVDQAQGFFWSRALAPDELMTWLAKRPWSGDAAPSSAAPADPPCLTVALPARDEARIRQMLAEGASLHTVAAALNAEGRRTPSGPRWTTTTVARVVAPVRPG